MDDERFLHLCWMFHLWTLGWLWCGMEVDLRAMLTHICILRLVAQTSLPSLTRWLKTGALRKHVTIHLHMHLTHKVSPTWWRSMVRCAVFQSASEIKFFMCSFLWSWRKWLMSRASSTRRSASNSALSKRFQVEPWSPHKATRSRPRMNASPWR